MGQNRHEIELWRRSTWQAGAAIALLAALFLSWSALAGVYGPDTDPTHETLDHYVARLKAMNIYQLDQEYGDITGAQFGVCIKGGLRYVWSGLKNDIVTILGNTLSNGAEPELDLCHAYRPFAEAAWREFDLLPRRDQRAHRELYDPAISDAMDKQLYGDPSEDDKRGNKKYPAQSLRQDP